MRTIENFGQWNDEMSRRYTIDEYREKSRWFIRWVESLRDRTILKHLDVKPQDHVIDLGCGAGEPGHARNRVRPVQADEQKHERGWRHHVAVEEVREPQ